MTENSLDQQSLAPAAEGVIKFQLQHRQEALSLSPAQLAEINSWRLLLLRLQLLGQDPARYEGLAYGNVSVRACSDSDQFLISATQTSAKELLAAADICLVEQVNLAANTLQACGVSKPSSEALTHASVYQTQPAVRAVIHVHSQEIWRYTAALALPSTAAHIAYGTPDMALAVAELLRTQFAYRFGVFSMLGHADGVVAFADSLAAAAGLIIQVWGAAQALQLTANQNT